MIQILHGTHVAITISGDGTGDPSATGIAPESYIVAYALEHNPTGIFGRIGFIYDMLNHAEQEGSRVAVNAWGLNGNRGAYTADARSVDVFVKDNLSFYQFSQQEMIQVKTHLWYCHHLQQKMCFQSDHHNKSCGMTEIFGKWSFIG